MVVYYDRATMWHFWNKRRKVFKIQSFTSIVNNSSSIKITGLSVSMFSVSDTVNVISDDNVYNGNGSITEIGDNYIIVDINYISDSLGGTVKLI